MPSNWAKQRQQLMSVRYFNSGAGDAVLGGSLTGVPSGLTVSQGGEDRPGDRIVLGSADALALSDTTVGTLYGGLYQYVTHKLTSTATPTRGRLVFHDLSVADSAYQVTPDEDADITYNLPAGLSIITTTKGYHWWILAAGKGVGRWRGTLTGTAAIGVGAYTAGAGAGADVGTLDLFSGAGNPTVTYALLDKLQNGYIGVAEVLPVAGSNTIIDVALRRSYRL